MGIPPVIHLQMDFPWHKTIHLFGATPMTLETPIPREICPWLHHGRREEPTSRFRSRLWHRRRPGLINWLRWFFKIYWEVVPIIVTKGIQQLSLSSSMSTWRIIPLRFMIWLMKRKQQTSSLMGFNVVQPKKQKLGGPSSLTWLLGESSGSLVDISICNW